MNQNWNGVMIMNGATEDELKKFVEYILSFKRDDVLTHIVEGG